MVRWSRMIIRAVTPRRLLCGVIGVSALILIFNYNGFNIFSRSRSRSLIDTVEYMYDSQYMNPSQDHINYMAENIDVTWTVKGNYKTYAEHLLVLKNNGGRAISNTNWIMCFHHIRILQPVEQYVDDRYTHDILLGTSGLRISHVTGLLYCIYPDKTLFKTLNGGEDLIIPIQSSHFQLSRTDCFPNWYVVGPGAEPRIIKSTEGESLSFVRSFEHPQQWKRSNEDEHDPYTPSYRYNLNREMEDLKMPGKLLIPTPELITVTSKEPLLVNPTEWFILNSDEFPMEMHYLSEKLGIKVVTETKNRKYIKAIFGKVTFSKDEKDDNEEAYELRVDDKSQTIHITSSTSHGIFNGIQSLLNMADVTSFVYNIPSVLVRDKPRFRYRGYMVDVSRNFHPKETILTLLDMMAMYKLNKFHFHLSDDDGWRIEIPDIPELTQFGSQRCHSENMTVCLAPSLGSGPFRNQLGSGYYTMKEYKEILAYAHRRHIQVIPEIDMPSHMRAAIKSLLLRHQHSSQQTDPYKMTHVEDGNNYRSAQGFNDNSANPCREGLYTFLNKIIDTFIDAHKDIQPLTLYHFGGDEIPRRAIEDMKCSLKIGDFKQYFIKRIVTNEKYKKLSYAAWEDGLLQDKRPYSLSDFNGKKGDLYAFVWTEGNKALFKMANAGYKVVNCRGAYMYFDHPYEPDPEERGLYWAARFINTSTVFKFNPMKGNEDYGKLEKPENIIGIQAQLWTELVRTRDQFDYMTYPRLQAMAERAWHRAPWEVTENKADQTRDWIDFANTIGYREMPRMDRLHVQYRLPLPGAIIQNGILKVNTIFPGLPVEYSIDKPGQERKWFVVKGGEVIHEPIVLRTRSPDGKRHSREVRFKA